MRQRLMRAAVRGAMAVPWFVRFAGRKRHTGNDARLDHQVAAALEFERIARLPALDSMAIPAARRYAEEGMSPLDLDPVPMAEVIDTTVGTIPVRIFVPHDAGPHWLVYFHGGGGVIGSIRASEPVTRYLAQQTRCTVASVEYRLGPEDKHPAAIEDACAAYAGLLERVPGGVAVGGDSFGGFLAAHVDHWSRTTRSRTTRSRTTRSRTTRSRTTRSRTTRSRTTHIRSPDVQLLIYPLVDLTLASPSIERLGEGYLLTKQMVHWFRANYLHADDDPEAASPWFWTDLEGSAPAIIATAGYDPLVDEGDAWADRLREAGTEVRHYRFDTLIHGFLSIAGAVDAARAATDELCRDVVEMLSFR